jgi:hypothetical protein
MPAKKKLYLQTTTVDAAKSMAEITAVLVAAGARTVQTTYEAGKPAGLEWSMVLYDRPVFFRMPAKAEPVCKMLHRQQRSSITRDREAKLREQAERIAWRQLLAWVQVQMSLIEIGMVEYAQVFLPYMTNATGSTIWDVMRESQFRAIEAPKQ